MNASGCDLLGPGSYQPEPKTSPSCITTHECLVSRSPVAGLEKVYSSQAPSGFAFATATTESPEGYPLGPSTSLACRPTRSGSTAWAMSTSLSSKMNTYHWPSMLSAVL